MFQLPQLPYAMNGLVPYISEETLNYHYGKHHQTYVNNLNNLVKDTSFATMSLEEIIQSNPNPGIFNNAAQIWNHTFYFEALAKDQTYDSHSLLAQKINESFNSFEDFQNQFNQSAITNFGSGWTWLVLDTDTNKLKIVNTSNAATVITEKNQKPLLCVDVWEHAYYIDYRNARPEYLKNFWPIINWKVVKKRLA